MSAALYINVIVDVVKGKGKLTCYSAAYNPEQQRVYNVGSGS